MKPVKLFKAFASGFLALAFVSCGGGNDSENSKAVIDKNLRFIQLTRNAPVSHILIDNKVFYTDLSYLEDTEFLKGPTVDINLKMAPSDSENFIASNYINIDLINDESFTTFILKGDYKNTPFPEAVAIETDRTPAASNEAKLKWVHAASSLAIVDYTVYIVDKDNNCTSPKQSAQFATMISYDSKSFEAHEISAGVYDICIVPLFNGYQKLLIDNYELNSRLNVTFALFEEDQLNQLALYKIDNVSGERKIVSK